MTKVKIHGTEHDLEEFLESAPKNKPLDENGHEVLDPTPIAPPIGYTRTPSLAEQIRSMVRSEKLAQAARDAGQETFEEADDFDIGEDYEPDSPYQANFDPMTPEERAALASQGRDVDRIIPPEPKKKAAPRPAEPPVSPPGDPSSD